MTCKKECHKYDNSIGGYQEVSTNWQSHSCVSNHRLNPGCRTFWVTRFDAAPQGPMEESILATLPKVIPKVTDAGQYISPMKCDKTQ